MAGPRLPREAIEGDPALGGAWYYAIELAEGLYTPGKDRRNIALTRRLLRRTDIGPGTRCLDIGIQEGLMSILMERRGANVVAYDRIFSKERLGLVRRALGTSFELIGRPIRNIDKPWWRVLDPVPDWGVPLTRLPAELSERGHEPFDVVVFSGILYHLLEPLGGLSVMRGLVRNGGIVIVETVAIFDDSISLHLNAGSRFSPYAIWLPSLASLDYMLRIVRLEPLEAVYVGRQRGRVAVACRAVDAPPADSADQWIHGHVPEFELAEYFDWSSVSSEAEPIGYVADTNAFLNVLEAVRRGRPQRPGPEEMRLDLDALY